MSKAPLTIGAVVVIGIIIIAAVFVLTSQPHPTPTTTVTIAPSSSGNVRTPVMITDPAQVASGTTALVFTYSNVQVNDTTISGSTWVNANGSGSVNLIAIQNMTQVIGYASVPANSTISAFRLNITSVMITVNGTTYQVPVSSNMVTIPVSGSQKVVAGSGVLLDYTPTVSPAFSNNATVFVRVPAAKAAIVSGINSTLAADIGATVPISAGALAVIAAVTPTVNITSASLSAQGNSTLLTLVVKNNGNQSTVINTVNVFGAQRVRAVASVRAGVNASLATNVNAALSGGLIGKSRVQLELGANALVGVGHAIGSYGMQTFSVSPSGSLVFVSSLSDVQSGITLAPGASATLVYNSTAMYNNGTFTTLPVAGAAYRITVVGSTGAFASTIVKVS